MKNILPIFLACLFLAPPGLMAQDLYSGVVAVEGQGESERRSAVPKALRHVLGKLSGQADLGDDPALTEALRRANELLLSFQYREYPRTLPDGSEQEELQLVASFLPQGVDQLVRDLGLPRWRVERDPVIVWVVLDDGRGRAFMPVEYQYAFDHLQSAAQYRGLPMQWPGLSEELMAQVDLQVLWGGYTDQLLVEGSQSAGAVIVAARRDGTNWLTRWTFADGTSSQSWQTRNGDLSLALEDGVNQLTDRVAASRSIGPAGLGEWTSEIVIRGLRSAADYARCLSYLEDLAVVDDAAVQMVDSEGVRFHLRLNADPRYLEESLQGDGVLENDGPANEFRLAP